MCACRSVCCTASVDAAVPWWGLALPSSGLCMQQFSWYQQKLCGFVSFCRYWKLYLNAGDSNTRGIGNKQCAGNRLLDLKTCAVGMCLSHSLQTGACPRDCRLSWWRPFVAQLVLVKTNPARFGFSPEFLTSVVEDLESEQWPNSAGLIVVGWFDAESVSGLACTVCVGETEIGAFKQ